MDEPWGRMPQEGSKQYAAFMTYLTLPVRIRSMDRAWRITNGIDEDDMSIGNRRIAPSHWRAWASKHRWLERAKAYDEYQAERDLELWEERRQRAKERDWEQADRLRAIVDGALPSAEQFFRRQTTTIPGTPTVVGENGEIIRMGTPAQTIITLAFQVTDLTRVLVEASKMQRLTLNEPTDNINNLSGYALDIAIERALAQRALEILPDGRETADAQGAFEPAAFFGEEVIDGDADD